jgi:hypothetical protein
MRIVVKRGFSDRPAEAFFESLRQDHMSDIPPAKIQAQRQPISGTA